MIVLSNTTAQTVAPGQTITFDSVVLHSGCGECHRANTGSVKLRANGQYMVNYSANVAGTVAASPVSLAISLGGQMLPETNRISTPTVANTEFNAISATTTVRNCCGDYDRVTLVNSGTAPIIVGPNAALFIKRVS